MGIKNKIKNGMANIVFNTYVFLSNQLFYQNEVNFFTLTLFDKQKKFAHYQ